MPTLRLTVQPGVFKNGAPHLPSVDVDLEGRRKSDIGPVVRPDGCIVYDIPDTPKNRSRLQADFSHLVGADVKVIHKAEESDDFRESETVKTLKSELQAKTEALAKKEAEFAELQARAELLESELAKAVKAQGKGKGKNQPDPEPEA